MSKRNQIVRKVVATLFAVFGVLASVFTATYLLARPLVGSKDKSDFPSSEHSRVLGSSDIFVSRGWVEDEKISNLRKLSNFVGVLNNL